MEWTEMNNFQVSTCSQNLYSVSAKKYQILQREHVIQRRREHGEQTNLAKATLISSFRFIFIPRQLLSESIWL